MKSAKKAKKPLRTHTSAQRKKAKRIVKQNRRLHHRIFLHPITVFILLCLGVLIVTMTFRAAAASYTVRGKVPAPPLAEAATISAPADLSITNASIISVQGKCPPASYVVLTRNGAMSGVAVCDANNTYSIETSLYIGTNVLKVQDFNITDDAGPETKEIQVIHLDAKSATYVTGSNKPNSTETPISIPLLSSAFQYLTFERRTSFEWPLDISQGVAPYRLDINWGDGTSSEQDIDGAQTVQLSHRYDEAGNYKIIVKVTDFKGTVSVLQLYAIIKLPGSLALSGTLNGSGGQAGGAQGQASVVTTGFKKIEHTLVFAWGTYATVTLMSVSFMLGERQKVAAIISAKQAITKRPKTK
jgi:hypothetical protein